ncbi:MAG: 50S ribosomal protein L22 [Candidatus Riflebacteria bacterium]|nr:50S ribosomal protein L22 [Candidatus Riflebacteria bacterium]
MPRAVLTNIPGSPRKIRLIADEIRGKDVDEAMSILRFMEKGHAKKLLKLLQSAVKNAENNHGLKNVDDLYIAKITIDEGPMMKRYMPRARGRADRIKCRTSHAKIVLRERFSMAKFGPQQAADTQPAKKAVKKAVKKKVSPAAEKAPKAQGGKN